MWTGLIWLRMGEGGAVTDTVMKFVVSRNVTKSRLAAEEGLLHGV